jgi:hypothetical protein
VLVPPNPSDCFHFCSDSSSLSSCSHIEPLLCQVSLACERGRSPHFSQLREPRICTYSPRCIPPESFVLQSCTLRSHWERDPCDIITRLSRLGRIDVFEVEGRRTNDSLIEEGSAACDLYVSTVQCPDRGADHRGRLT